MELRNTQNEILLSISNEIARIRGKEDMLNIIRNSIKKHIYFNDSFILRYNRQKRTGKPYIYQAEKSRSKNSKFKTYLDLEYFVMDDSIEEFLYPIVYDVASLLPGGSEQVDFMHNAGIKEFVVIKLIEGGQLIGLFILLSEQDHCFTPDGLDLLHKLSYQISIATANIIANEELEKREEEKTILLSLSNEIAALRNRSDLFQVVNTKLKKLFSINEFGIAQITQDGSTYEAFILELESPTKEHADFEKITTAKYRIDDPVFNKVMNTSEPVLFQVNELAGEPGVPAYVNFWKSVGLKQVLCMALRVGGHNIGCVFLHVDTDPAFYEKSNLLKGVCAQLSVAISNILGNEDIARRERERELLLSLNMDISAVRNNNDLLSVINDRLKKLLDFSHTLIAIINDDADSVRAFLLDPGSKSKDHPIYLEVKQKHYPVNDGILNTALVTSTPLIYNLEELQQRGELPLYLKINFESGVRHMILIRFSTGNEVIGFWMLFFIQKINLDTGKASLIEGLANQISIAVSNIIANDKVNNQLQEINSYKQQLEEEKTYLKEEIETSQHHAEIIGNGPEMKKVLRLVTQVSASDSTVLLLGETGTGKEVIARAIHNSSPRKNKLMVKVNCAALPVNLIESELFGHERGSFTGAIERRIGKFELANNGTLFLDEIGEMPLELQVKLLRALQEKEIERVGGKTTIKVDVRIIAATNRNLEKLMEEGRFRTDLYYRLNIFPISLPPLRNRREDIPLLALHFILRFSKKAGKQIDNFSNKVLQELLQYDWPGNIRELEHLIERSVLLAKGDIIKEIHLPTNKNVLSSHVTEEIKIKTLDENEREHILKILKLVKGKISGEGGAAELLGVPASTLSSRMKRLGIRKEHFG